MELAVVSGLIMLVIGFLAGRMSIKDGQDSGGMQFHMGPDLLQVEGWVVRVIWRKIMNPAEQAAMFIVDELYAQGKQPTEVQLAHAQTAWVNAFKRWIPTDDGQDWAAKNAPHLLGE